MTDSDDYQIGVHDIDTSGAITEEDEVIEFEMETEAVFKRLADDIYQSAEAGVREPLMNSITSVRRAFNGNTSEGVIEITVHKGQQVTLSIRDNGLGITRDILEDVLTVIGRSEVRDDGKLAGQYGMGFLASYKLVGPDGGFFMHTNPRDGESYKGMFRPGAFEPDTDGRIPDLMDNSRYGTAFQYHLKESIDHMDIRMWVENHAKWSPVPVIYKEIDENGEEEYNEDFGCSSLTDIYDVCVSFENEYIEAVASPDSEGETILISSPMSIKGTQDISSRVPWSVDVRLKYENGIVVNGPNEGLAPVTKEEYNSMSDERKQKYVPKKQLTSKDLKLPSPVGTREKMKTNAGFADYVNSKILEAVKDCLGNAVENVDLEKDDFTDLTKNQKGSISMISDAVGSDTLYSFVNLNRGLRNEKTPAAIRKKISNITDTKVDESCEWDRFIELMSQDVTEHQQEHNNRTPLYQHVTNGDYETTFTCVSTGTWKKDAVVESDKNIRVLRVPNANWYADMTKFFGWEPLKNINPSRAEKELGLTSQQVTDIRGKSAEDANVEDKKVNVRLTSRETQKMKAENVRKDFSGSISHRMCSHLLLFPRGAEKNISDNKSLADQSVAIASCSKDVFDYLTEDSENIIHYNEYKNVIGDKMIRSSKGSISLDAIVDFETLFILPTDGKNRKVKDISVLNSLHQSVAKKESVSTSRSVLAVVESGTWNKLGTLQEISEDLDSVVALSYPPRNTTYTGRNKFNMSRYNLLEIYCEDKLDDEMVNIVTVKFDTLNDMSINFADKLSEAGEIESEENNSSNNLPKHQTAEGMLTIKEIYDSHEPKDVVIHVISHKDVDTFKNTELITQANKNLSGDRLVVDKFDTTEDMFYVPISSSTYQTIEDKIENRTNVIGYVSNTRRHGYNRSEDWFNLCVYANIKLHSWSNRNTATLVRDLKFERGKKLIDQFKPLHDEGEDPPILDDSGSKEPFADSNARGIM